MPALLTHATELLGILIDRDAVPSAASSLINAAGNGTGDAPLQVVCAWPVSGQYGPGSRVLYYVLVATCVLARKAEWLRSACLAAALVLPAVAALHGIILAAIHVDGAVDMDIYGAFQVCAIATLAGPVTARLSRTYFFNPGRNTIFLWTILMIAGLLSLTVEFYRANPVGCAFDDDGFPISRSPGQFPYDDEPKCGLVCDPDEGPHNPLRRDATDDIYVIPSPAPLTFGMGTLLAAACCIPAILSLVSMWNKIVEINWKTNFGHSEEGDENDRIEGTNGATVKKMKGVNAILKSWLSVIEVPIFSAAVLAVLILGELNLFSPQMRYRTEPIQSIGQWGPIVATGLIALGSLYMLLAGDMETVKNGGEIGGNGDAATIVTHHCNCSNHHHVVEGRYSVEPAVARRSTDERADGGGEKRSNSSSPPVGMRATSRGRSRTTSTAVNAPEYPSEARRSSSSEAADVVQSIVGDVDLRLRRLSTNDVGGRRKVAETLTRLSRFLETAGQDMYDLSDFQSGRAMDFPLIPGEEHRNPDLSQIKKQYNAPRDENDDAASMRPRSRSRARSFTNSVASGIDAEGEPVASSSHHRPSVGSNRRSRSDTLNSERQSLELRAITSTSTTGSLVFMPPKRRDTLEVPSQGLGSPTRSELPPSPTTPTTPSIAVPGGQGSPAIVISADSDITSSGHEPVLAPPTSRLAAEARPPPRDRSPPRSKKEGQ